MSQDLQAVLVARLQRELGSLISKAEGVSEYDARRPLTGSGTNLLGLVQHTSAVVLGYLTECVGREPGWEMAFFADDAEQDADLWVAADVPREHVLALGRHTLAAIASSAQALTLDSPGVVPWWGEDGQVTFGELLIHTLAETARHAGHADIVREGLDGSLGSRPDDPNVPGRDAVTWSAYTARIQAAADTFRT